MCLQTFVKGQCLCVNLVTVQYQQTFDCPVCHKNHCRFKWPLIFKIFVSFLFRVKALCMYSRHNRLVFCSAVVWNMYQKKKQQIHMLHVICNCSVIISDNDPDQQLYVIAKKPHYLYSFLFCFDLLGNLKIQDVKLLTGSICFLYSLSSIYSVLIENPQSVISIASSFVSL